MRTELNQSGVLFDKESHTYHLNGKELSGITEMIQRQLYGEEYKDVPQALIERAGQYGTQVHEAIENFDASSWEHDGSVEIQDYIELCKENGLIHESSEYTVTDSENFASNIDKVYRVNDNTFDLADIKTYGAMTKDKLQKARWQLSILAYLFELTNPKAKVNRLIVLHIRNKVKENGSIDHIKDFSLVDRIPSEIVKELLKAEIEGRQFLNPYAIPFEYASQEQRIRQLLLDKEAIELELSEIKADFMSTMERLDITTWRTESGMRITRKLPTTRTSFDLGSFRREHPGLNYNDHYKTTNVSGSVTIAV